MPPTERVSNARAVASALLYEGYVLYPYRASALKNRARFDFGVLFPRAFVEREAAHERAALRCEVLVSSPDGEAPQLQLALRFLQLGRRSARAPGAGNAVLAERREARDEEWLEAVEREWVFGRCSIDGLVRRTFGAATSFDGRRAIAANDASPRVASGIDDVELRGVEAGAEVSAASIGDHLWRLTITVRNSTELDASDGVTRNEALLRALVSAHLLLSVRRGRFISLTDPGDRFRDAADACRNEGVWPVLVGDRARCDALLAAPIIVSDFPEIAPESAGDFFDATEIDEMLTLRLLTLTEGERAEVRRTDARAARLLERAEALSEDRLLSLHGRLSGGAAHG